jgi:hypothetical protein
MEGRSTSEGFTEGIVPVFKDLPGGVHSLENVRYMAARELRSLARGNAFISYVGIEGWKGARVTVAHVKDAPAPADGGAGARAALLDASPSALPAADARAAVDRRGQEIFAAAAGPNSPAGEPERPRPKKARAAAGAKGEPPPEEPNSWRVDAPKRSAKPGRSHGKP